MSNIRPDDFRKHAAEEDFFRLAAMEIESEQNEEFLEAQSLPDPSPEVLQRMQANLQMTMRRTRKRKRRHTIFLHLGRFTACAAVILGFLFSGAYFGVEATRNTVNNFILEIFNDHAVVTTDVSNSQTGAVLPVDWQGPFFVSWIPSRFTYVHSDQIESAWFLIYQSTTNDDAFSIYVWDVYHSPNINVENLQLVSEENIQNTPARIYSDQDNFTYTLIWTKENYIIQIGGSISIEELRNIAENFVF